MSTWHFVNAFGEYVGGPTVLLLEIRQKIYSGFLSVSIRGILLKYVRMLIEFLLLYSNSQCHFPDLPTKFSWMCLRDSNFWTVGSLGTKIWRWFIECIWLLSLELVYTLVYFCKFCQNYNNGFYTLVLELFVSVFEGLKLLNRWEFGYQNLELIYWVYLSALTRTRLHIGACL